VDGERRDLAVVSDRGRDRLAIYDVGPGGVREVTERNAPLAFSRDQDEVAEQKSAYGLATFVHHGTAYAVVSRRSTSEMGLFRLVAEDHRITYHRVDSLHLPDSFRLRDGSHWRPCDEPGVGPQVEGVAVDTENRVLFAAQEDVALWRVPLRIDDDRVAFAQPSMVEKVREFGVPATYDPETEECTLDWARDRGEGGRLISADVEGVALYRDRDGGGYLLVSSQGDSSFLVFDRAGHRALGRFQVVTGRASDGAEHSDGAEIVNLPFGRAFPDGLVVVHDGEETSPQEDGEPREATNMKFLDWRAIARPLGLRIAPGPAIRASR
jgi:3-phytase